MQKAEIETTGSYANHFMMIVHDLFVSVKQVRIASYCFCLMLVLVIPQFEASVLFIFHLRIHIIPSVTRIVF